MEKRLLAMFKWLHNSNINYVTAGKLAQSRCWFLPSKCPHLLWVPPLPVPPVVSVTPSFHTRRTFASQLPAPSCLFKLNVLDAIEPCEKDTSMFWQLLSLLAFSIFYLKQRAVGMSHALTHSCSNRTCHESVSDLSRRSAFSALNSALCAEVCKPSLLRF